MWYTNASGLSLGLYAVTADQYVRSAEHFLPRLRIACEAGTHDPWIMPLYSFAIPTPLKLAPL